MRLRGDFGAELRRLRRSFRGTYRIGLTLGELSRKLNIDRMTLNRIELGKQHPSLKTYAVIKDTFESYEVDWLIKSTTNDCLPAHYAKAIDYESYEAQCLIGEMIFQRRISQPSKSGTSHKSADRMTLQELAAAASVSASTMSRIENGRVLSKKIFEICEISSDEREIRVINTQFAKCLGFKDEKECTEWLDEVNRFVIEIQPNSGVA